MVTVEKAGGGGGEGEEEGAEEGAEGSLIWRV